MERFLTKEETRKVPLEIATLGRKSASGDKKWTTVRPVGSQKNVQIAAHTHVAIAVVCEVVPLSYSSTFTKNKACSDTCAFQYHLLLNSCHMRNTNLHVFFPTIFMMELLSQSAHSKLELFSSLRADISLLLMFRLLFVVCL